jgi:O-antigen ligase
LLLLLFCWAIILMLWSPNLSIKPEDSSKGKIGAEIVTISRITTPLRHDLFALCLFVTNLLLFHLVVNSLDKEAFHRKVMWSWIIFGAIVSVFTIWSAVSNIQSLKYTFKIWDDVAFHTRLIFDKVRAAGLGTPHLSSLVLNMFTGITIGMLLIEIGSLKRFLLGTTALLMMLANLLTLTKGGLAGLVAMLHFFLVSFRCLRKNFFRNLILLYVVLFALVFLQIKISKEYRFEKTPRFMHKIGYVGAGKSRAALIWLPGLREFIKAGCIGLGVGTFTYATVSPHAHSIYFSTLFDFGIFGMVILIGMFFIILKHYFFMLKFQQTYLQIMFLSCCGVLVSIGVHGLVDFDYNTPVVWLFLGFYAATLQLAKEELARKTASHERQPFLVVHRAFAG